MNAKLTIKITFLLIFALQNGYAQSKQRLSSVHIEFSGFNIESFTRVNCGEYSRKMSTKSRTFKTKKDIRNFDSLALLFTLKQTTFSLSSEKMNSNIDTRGTIVFKYDQSYTYYCFDTFGNFFSNGETYENKKLFIYIIDRLYSEHPAYMDKL